MPSSERPSNSDAGVRVQRVRRSLVIDGIGWRIEGPADTPIAGIVRVVGAAVERCGETLADVVAGSAVGADLASVSDARRLVVVTGPDSGRSRVVPPGGSFVIGRRSKSTPRASGSRSPDVLAIDDPSISAQHCAVTLVERTASIRDCGSTNGTFIDGQRIVPGRVFTDDALLSLGRSTLRWKPVYDRPSMPPDGFDRSNGTFPIMRPPVVRTSPPRPIAVPVPSNGGTVRFRVRPASILGPLVGGLALALLLNPKLALLTLLSPVMMLLNLIDDRRTASRERRTGMQSFATSLATFTDEVARASANEASRRRGLHVDLDVVQDRALGVVPGLWGRRAESESGWAVRIGTGDVRWTPQLGHRGPFPPAVADVLRSVVLDAVPVTVDVGPGSVVTVVGRQNASVLRALTIQMAGGFGPSDLAIVVLDEASDPAVDEPRSGEWVQWFPHWMPVDELGPSVLAGPARHLVVVQFCGTGADAFLERQRLRDLVPNCAFLVGVGSPDDVPTETTMVVDVASAATDTIVDLLDGGRRHDLIVDGTSIESATLVSRAMARWRDPLDESGSSSLSERVSLYDIVGDRGGAVAWSPGIRRDELAVPLGVGPGGVRWIDFVHDGPHALIAGTTGAGKSELLRTLVTSLALRYSPGEVTFVLIDYKGGSAFAECVDLPHTVGLVTDLDDGLAARALTCLEAELRRREHVLRNAEARDLASYDGSGGLLPRLVVVIDELAALIRDLPSFVGALVSLAQRGRSLGLHLVLATQRPAGTINDAIRANTNLRIALRVQDGADSVDVIGEVGASLLERRVPGRALIRLGPGEVSPVQVASVSIPSERRVVTGVRLDGGHRFAFRTNEQSDVDAPSEDEESLGSVARRLNEEAIKQGMAEPRRPWPPPLPRQRRWCAGPDGVPADGAVGICDVPSEQRQERLAVDLRRGGIGVVGSLGSGVSSTLHSLVVALAAATDPAMLHVYVIELVGRDLEGLAALPHIGAVVGPHEEERRERLLNSLDDVVAQRRHRERTPGSDRDGGARSRGNAEATPVGAQPMVVLVVDGWSAARSGSSDVALALVGERIQRLATAGANVGIRIVVGTDRATSLSSAMAPLLAHRWVLSPADHQEAAAAGVRFSASAVGIPGRAVVAGPVACELQVFHSGQADVESVAAAWTARGAVRSASSIGVMPTEVTFSALRRWPDNRATNLDADDDGWVVPFGVAWSTLTKASLVLRCGEPVLITGPPRSGRTSALATIAASVRSTDTEVEIVRFGANANRRFAVDSRPPAECQADASVTHPRELVDGVARLLAGGRRVIVLIDDADRLDDNDGAFRGLIEDRAPGLRVVIAVRPDAVRTTFGHWTAAARRTRQGLALRPNLDVDGEVWHTPFPRRLRIGSQPGAALLTVDGAVEIVQVALNAEDG